MKLKKMFAVIVLVAIISVSFAGYHYFFVGKEQFEGDSSPPIVSNASLANVSILLKLEGVLVKIASDMNESAVCSLLQKELEADVNPVGEGVYEIRKNITELQNEGCIRHYCYSLLFCSSTLLGSCQIR